MTTKQIAQELEKQLSPEDLAELQSAPPEEKAEPAPEKVKSAPLSTIRASDVEPKSAKWLWRNVLVRGGLNSIQGIAGIGKTFLICAVCAAVSGGGEVQSVDGGMERLSGGNVLFLTGDDDISTTIVPRLNTFGASLSNIHFPPGGMLPPIGSAVLAELFDYAKPTLCIIDTLQHFLPPRVDLNSANAVTGALQPLKLL